MNTRFFYDDCRTIMANELSTYQGRYALDTPGNGTHPYYVNDPMIRCQKWAGNLYTNSVDLESQLFNVPKNEKNSKYNMNYNYITCGSQQIQYPTTDYLTTEQSRSILPAHLFRDIPQQKYAYLPINPQANVCLTFQNNLSTRILDKDYYIPNTISCLP